MNSRLLFLIFFSTLLLSCDSSFDDAASETAIDSFPKDRKLSGVYKVMSRSKVIGREEFSVRFSESGEIEATSEAVLDDSYKYQHKARLAADSQWNILALVISFHG